MVTGLHAGALIDNPKISPILEEMIGSSEWGPLSANPRLLPDGSPMPSFRLVSFLSFLSFPAIPLKGALLCVLFSILKSGHFSMIRIFNRSLDTQPAVRTVSRCLPPTHPDSKFCLYLSLTKNYYSRPDCAVELAGPCEHPHARWEGWAHTRWAAAWRSPAWHWRRCHWLWHGPQR